MRFFKMLALNLMNHPRSRTSLLYRLFQIPMQRLLSFKDNRLQGFNNPDDPESDNYPPSSKVEEEGKLSNFPPSFVVHHVIEVLLYLVKSKPIVGLEMLRGTLLFPDATSTAPSGFLCGCLELLAYAELPVVQHQNLMELLCIITTPLAQWDPKVDVVSSLEEYSYTLDSTQEWTLLPKPILSQSLCQTLLSILWSPNKIPLGEEFRKRLLKTITHLGKVTETKVNILLQLVKSVSDWLPFNENVTQDDEYASHHSSPYSKLLQCLELMLELSDSVSDFTKLIESITNLKDVWTLLGKALSDPKVVNGSFAEWHQYVPCIEAFFRAHSAALSDDHDEMKMTVVHFVEKHRGVLNAIVSEYKPERYALLETSFSPLITLPRCRNVLEFKNKHKYFVNKMRKLRQSSNLVSLRLQVRRDQVFEDSFNSLRMRTAEELHGRLHVTFYREEGIDAGGLTREWYTILGREIFNPNYALFTKADNTHTYQPNSSSSVNKEHLTYFKFVGQIFGKAIVDGQLLDAHFTRSFYKHMLQLPITYHDIEAIDPEYYRNLVAMLEHPLEVLGLELSFSVEHFEFGQLKTTDLKPNGRSILVNDTNKMEYLKLVTHHKMTTGIQTQIDAFLSGFHELVSPKLISIFNEKELELLISGTPEIDIDDLKAHTNYTHYKSSDAIISWFWEALYSFTQEERALFVQFVTGTSKVPLEGFNALEGMRGPQHFNIHKAFISASSLPTAHTCFNQLDLPEYESSTQLKERLLLALREGSVGFGFA